jgi:hypothetical protein
MAFVFVEKAGGLDVQHFTCKLRLYVDSTTQKYDYRFEENAFVLGDPNDTIEFELDNAIAGGTVRIVKHVSTPCEPRGAPEKKVKVLTFNQDAVDDNADYIHHREDVRKASYTLNLEPNEMLHLGLIVEIWHPNHPDKPALLLCDPQVGNGPPTPQKPLDGTTGPTSR